MGHPPLLGFDLDGMPDDLRDKILADMDANPTRESDQLPCTWYNLETKRCRHHEYRPTICRDFETGSDGCLNYRDFYGVGNAQQHA